MKKIVIGEADLLSRAVSYVPAAVKAELVDACYNRCFTRLNVSMGDEGDTPMPYMYMEDTFLKSRFLMTAFAKLWLRSEDVETEEGDETLMTVECYDRWAGSHVFGQIERLKGVKACKDKAFDLLKDYKDLERRLSTAVRDALTVMNDPVNRMFQHLQATLSQEALEQQKTRVEDLRRQAEGLRETVADGGKDGGEADG